MAKHPGNFLRVSESVKWSPIRPCLFLSDNFFHQKIQYHNPLDLDVAMHVNLKRLKLTHHYGFDIPKIPHSSFSLSKLDFFNFFFRIN